MLVRNEMDGDSLQLQDYGVAFSDRIVLTGIDLNIPRRGVQIVTGPGGSGKSTLARSLAGFNDAQPSHRTWGRVTYNGAAMSGEHRPVLVAQNSRLLISSVFENLASALSNRQELSVGDQKTLLTAALRDANLEEVVDCIQDDVLSLSLGARRQLAILRSVLSEPALLCVDEATAELPDDWSKRILDYLIEVSSQRAVLFITHNRSHAMRLGGKTALLAGGRIIENRTTLEFYEAPTEELSKSFVRSGNCAAPSPSAKPEELTPVARRLLPPVIRVVESLESPQPPSGFRWLLKNQLAGTSRPGLLRDLEDDLAGLRAMGIDKLVTLEEIITVPVEKIHAYKMGSAFLPIVDMRTPSFAEAENMCERVARWITDGIVVAFHCRAGLGRTGTLLACYLILQGQSAIESLDRARRINPHWVQSDEQLKFLTDFESYLRQKRRAVA